MVSARRVEPNPDWLYEDARDICEMKSVIRLKHGRERSRGGEAGLLSIPAASDPGRWRGWLADEG
jgi:hypothetical protein